MADHEKFPVMDGEVFPDANIGETDSEVSEKKGTTVDRHAMWRMGKVQQFRRNFRFLSMFGFSMILMASWETLLGTSTIGLIDGGTAGLIWMYLICWVGLVCINTSMAEMGSMAPTSGGQYHWVCLQPHLHHHSWKFPS